MFQPGLGRAEGSREGGGPEESPEATRSQPKPSGARVEPPELGRPRGVGQGGEIEWWGKRTPLLRSALAANGREFRKGLLRAIRGHM